MQVVVEILKKYWWQIALGVIVIVILIVIYQKGKSKGAEASEEELLEKPKILPLPTDVAGQPLTQSEGQRVREISNLLYDDMKGTNLTGHDVAPYRALANLGDKMFLAVYDDFNTQHMSKGEGTLKEWLTDEVFVYLTEERNLVYNNILPRMARLNLV